MIQGSGEWVGRPNSGKSHNQQARPEPQTRGRARHGQCLRAIVNSFPALSVLPAARQLRVLIGTKVRPTAPRQIGSGMGSMCGIVRLGAAASVGQWRQAAKPTTGRNTPGECSPRQRQERREKRCSVLTASRKVGMLLAGLIITKSHEEPCRSGLCEEPLPRFSGRFGGWIFGGRRHSATDACRRRRGGGPGHHQCRGGLRCGRVLPVGATMRPGPHGSAA